MIRTFRNKPQYIQVVEIDKDMYNELLEDCDNDYLGDFKIGDFAIIDELGLIEQIFPRDSFLALYEEVNDASVNKCMFCVNRSLNPEEVPCCFCKDFSKFEEVK